MRLNSPHINIITKACMKASRFLIRDYGEIENLLSNQNFCLNLSFFRDFGAKSGKSSDLN